MTDTEAPEALTQMRTQMSEPNAVVHIEVHGLGDGKIDLQVASSGVHLSDDEVRDILRSALLAMDVGTVLHADTDTHPDLDADA